jgi:hypothetical protein
MSKSTVIWVGIAAVAVAGVAVLGSLRHTDELRPTPTAVAPTEPAPATANSRAGSEHVDPIAAGTEPDDAVPEEKVTAQANDQTFRVNDSGRLVLDEQTRLNMEALFARTPRDDLAKAKQQAVEPLPAGAAAQATDLLENYDNYQQAQRQAYPPGVAPATEEAALAELEGLHALRSAHFGAVIARALYGEEEIVSRQLIELMRLEKDQSLTMEEKAERAQQIERRNREDPH